MSTYLNRLLLITFLILIFPVMSFVQGNSVEEDYPADITKYGLSLMGSTSAISPRAVIQMDNNWEILLTCLSEKMKDELRAKNISFTDSQLLMLNVMRLLDVKEDKLKTVMPILGSKKMKSLRKKMRDLSIKIEPDLRSDVDAFKIELKKIGRGENVYTILFSYILDELALDSLYEKGLIESSSPSTEKPFWRGSFWAVYPKRAFQCGTDKMESLEISIMLNWSNVLGDKMWEGFNTTNFRLLYNDLIKYDKVINDELHKELSSYRIFDSSGNLTVPIIVQKENNSLYQKCKSLALKASELFVENVDIERLIEEYELLDEESAVAVSYHEWMWEYMDYLEEKEIVKKPFAFSNPNEAKPEDIGALLFIVKTSNK